MIALLASGVRLGSTTAFLSIGELLSERAGVLNVGLAGLLLVSAFGATAGGAATGSVTIAVLTAIASGVLAAALIGVLVLWTRADQIVAGLAFNLLALGLTTFLYRTLYSESLPKLPTVSAVHIPGLSDLPWVGPVLFAQPPLFYLLVILMPLTWLLLHNSGWGLRIRAAGNSPETLHALGADVLLTRFTAMLWTGGLAGLAGAYLLLAEAGEFTEGMSGGRGFTAIAAVVFGGWRVWGVLGASFVFGLAEALQYQLPAMGIDLPNPFLLGMPYLVALLAVALLPQRGSAPVRLMVPFDAKTA